MEIIILILAIIVLSSISLLGAFYVKKYKNPDLLLGLYVAFVLVSNIVAYKIALYDFGIFEIYATSGVIVFSITFLLTDIVNEKFGLKTTQKMIFISFLSQIISILLILFSIYLTPAGFWADQESFSRILGFTPRVVIASLVAFLISENLDAFLFTKFKAITKGKHLWARNIFSSIPSMALDTFLFVFFAFYGIQPVLKVFIGILIIKWMVGIIDIPFMYLNRYIIFKRDNQNL
jgi:uncharacterized integral membrane protein (TIGR00697 family)